MGWSPETLWADSEWTCFGKTSVQIPSLVRSENSSDAERGKQDVTLRRGISVTLVLPGKQRDRTQRTSYVPLHTALFCFVLLELVELFHLVRWPSRLGIRCSEVVSMGLDAVNF